MNAFSSSRDGGVNVFSRLIFSNSSAALSRTFLRSGMAAEAPSSDRSSPRSRWYLRELSGLSFPHAASTTASTPAQASSQQGRQNAVPITHRTSARPHPFAFKFPTSFTTSNVPDRSMEHSSAVRRLRFVQSLPFLVLCLMLFERKQEIRACSVLFCSSQPVPRRFQGGSRSKAEWKK